MQDILCAGDIVAGVTVNGADIYNIFKYFVNSFADVIEVTFMKLKLFVINSLASKGI